MQGEIAMTDEEYNNLESSIKDLESRIKDLESNISVNIDGLIKELIVSVFTGSSSSSVLDKTDPRSVLPHNGPYWSSGAS